MGIYKVKDRRGRRRYVVSKYWPHGSGRLMEDSSSHLAGKTRQPASGRLR